ncbi:MAG: NO-inducible flavohemoprotein [Oceanospirillaceae bacterium]
MLTDQHISIIKSTIPLLEQAGSALTTYFYQRMFKESPELQNIFNMSNQSNGRQQVALFEAIAAYAKNIENLAALTTAVERIAQKHTSFAIQAEHYAIVGHNLIETLRELAPDAFTPEVEEAWTAAYQFLAQIFIDREAQLYQQTKAAAGGWNGCRDFVVSSKKTESAFVKSFVFTPVDGEGVIGYLPGQYIGLDVLPVDSEFREIRQYSLSNKANGSDYRISVKRENHPVSGVVSNYLHDHLQEGDVVQLHPPAGDFHFVDRGHNVALISAGVGVTPMQAMLEQLSADDYAHKIHYLHACENAAAHSFALRTQSLCDQPNREQHSWYLNGENTNENGHSGYIDLNCAGIALQETDFYLCGPVVFMQFMKQQLLGLDVAQECIHYEVFGPHQGL